MYTYCVFDDSKNMYGQCIFKSKGLFFLLWFISPSVALYIGVASVTGDIRDLFS